MRSLGTILFRRFCAVISLFVVFSYSLPSKVIYHSGNTPIYHYYIRDYQGNNRVVINQNGIVEQTTHYYPFGGEFAEGTASSLQPYKYSGKEFTSSENLNLYDFHARHYDPTLGQWMTQDPLSSKYPGISQYVYCINNPVRCVDPDGRDVYRYDDKTGEMILHKKTDDNFDQIGKFKQDRKSGEYTLLTNKRGDSKTRIDNIEKGILSDGMNFKDNNNIIDVGGEIQASVVGVENFLLDFSNLIDKELGGYYLSDKNSNDISHIYIGKFKNNTAQEAKSGFDLYRARPDLYNNIDIKVDFHTPLSRFGDSDRLRPSNLGESGGDVGHKARQIQIIPTLKFLIITNPNPFYY